MSFERFPQYLVLFHLCLLQLYAAESVLTD